MNDSEKLIIDNVNLIYIMLNKFNVDKDDYYDIGLIGLIKGARTYNETRGVAVSTYLCKCISNEILQAKRKNKLITVSLSEPLKIDEKLCLEDILKSEKDNIKDCENKLILKELMSCLSKKEYDIISGYFGINSYQYNQYALAKKYGISPSYVSRVIKISLKKMKKYSEGLL